MSPVAEAVPVAVPAEEPDTARFEQAAQVLERAVQAGCQDPNVLYMLALAHKRRGKIIDARNALRKIARPDANVVLQMGLLSLQEQQLAQAEGEFARAWQMGPNSYEICYNLLLTRLTLGKARECLDLIPRALELAEQKGGSAAEERRFLQVLQALLQACERSGEGGVSPLLAE